MADETILTWNATNWITVLLMVALGFTLLGFVAKWLKSRKATS